MVKKRACIQYSEEMLLHILGLDPSKYSLSRIYHEDFGAVKFIIEGDSLSEIVECQEPSLRTVDQIKEQNNKEN